MSGIYPTLLRRRAESMIKIAERLLGEGEYDLAVFNAEYATQLYIESLLYRLSWEEWRGHSIRTLLGALALVAEENELKEIAEKIYNFVRRNRRILAELEEAHARSIYGIFEYTRNQAKTLIDIAREVIEMIKEIEEKVFKQC